MIHRSLKPIIAIASLSISLAWSAQWPTFAKEGKCPVGVNVNSFQNFDPGKQNEIVEQLKASHVRFVRTSLRMDEKNLNLAKRLQDEGIGLVFVVGLQFKDGTPERPKNDQYHVREGRPISATDVERSRETYQLTFDKLDQKGVKATAFELGNELNWVDFNADFPVPGRGKAFDLQDLENDPVGKRVAKGFLLYIKALEALKDVRDHSKLNHDAPIITCGMASVTGGEWQKKAKMDGVTIPATYRFLKAHGVDKFVDGYGVHTYPSVVKPGDKDGLAKREQMEDEKIFPSFCDKPFWVTEWGFPSQAADSKGDRERTRSVEEIRAYFHRLHQDGRLGGMFWYVWNEPDRCSIYRDGTIMDAGRKATAPMHD